MTNLGIAVVVLALIALDANNDADRNETEVREVASNECQFPLRSSPGTKTCGVSILALVTNPEKNDRRRVHTVAYLQVPEGDADYYIAAPTRFALEASDLYSCVRVKAPTKVVADAGRSGRGLESGLYVADITGNFGLMASSWCVGVISEAQIEVRWRIETNESLPNAPSESE